VIDHRHRKQREIAAQVERPRDGADSRLGRLAVHRRQGAEISDDRRQVVVAQRGEGLRRHEDEGPAVPPHAAAQRALEIRVGEVADPASTAREVHAGEPPECRLVHPQFPTHVRVVALLALPDGFDQMASTGERCGVGCRPDLGIREVVDLADVSGGDGVQRGDGKDDEQDETGHGADGPAKPSGHAVLLG
jgi:hypothetical protein